MNVFFFFTITDIVTSQNTDLSFWITLYVSKFDVAWTLDHLADIRFQKQTSPCYDMLVADWGYSMSNIVIIIIRDFSGVNELIFLKQQLPFLINKLIASICVAPAKPVCLIR